MILCYTDEDCPTHMVRIWWWNQGIKKKWKCFFFFLDTKIYGDVRGSRHVLFNFFFYGFLLGKSNKKKLYKSYLGRKSQPCCINDPIANHIQFIKVNWVCIFSGCGSCGDGVGHSYGVNLNYFCYFVKLYQKFQSHLFSYIFKL